MRLHWGFALLGRWAALTGLPGLLGYAKLLGVWRKQETPSLSLEVTQRSCRRNTDTEFEHRVIGKNGETIKALQNYTGAQIQNDQRLDPTRVSIAGPAKNLQTAQSMVLVSILQPHAVSASALCRERQ